MKNQKIYFFLLLSFITPSHAGVIICSQIPQAAKDLLTKAQALVQKRLDHINATSEKQYLFEHNTYGAHITLRYITGKKLSLSDIQQAEPQLIDNLTRYAQSIQPIDMSQVMQKSELVIWDGKKENTYEGMKYKNYAVLAIKMNPSHALLSAVEKLDQILEKHSITQKREFPFSPHMTIGFIYDKNDIDPSAVITDTKPILEELIAQFKSDESFTIDSCKLSPQDQKEVSFKFSS